MPLASGTHLGPYEIISLIGAGGMGEVYRARDSRLRRDVAIKLLPDAVAENPDRRARFEREARVLASLNHPLIAAIYGVEERALVMELVEGASPKGPMPFEKAWKIAAQIADALEYAHENGIVHRDLKPANVIVTPEGSVKLLDFGLAKAFEPLAGDTREDPNNSSTLTIDATAAGMPMGTPAYMAPEQALGKKVDERADIWAWGVVLYELITGDRLFKGDSVAETLAQVLTKEPDLARVPPAVQPLLRRCLEKDPKQRLRAIGDAKLFLDQPAPIAHPPSRSRIGVWLAGAALLAALTTIFFLLPRATPAPQPMHLSIALPENTEVAPALSPDGRKIAISARTGVKYQLWIRSLDSAEYHPMGGDEAQNLFWSPDSRFIGFFGDGKLKIIPVAGGPSQTLCNTERGTGTWNHDGVILYASGNGIFRVPAAGGACTPIKEPENGTVFANPEFLPDDRHYFYSVTSDDAARGGVFLGSIGESAGRRILADQTGVVYAPPDRKGGSGYLLFVRDDALIAQPYDAEALRPDGEPITVTKHAAYPSIGGKGLLVYLANGEKSQSFQLEWLDRSGKIAGEIGKEDPPSHRPFGLALSPDDKMAAISRVDPGPPATLDLFVYDFSRNAQRRLTQGLSTIWSPDASRLVFSAGQGTSNDLYWTSINGGGGEELLLKNANRKYPSDLSRDGHYLIYTEIDPKTRADIWVLADPFSRSADHKPVPFLQTPFIESQGQLSPDSHWIAYVSFRIGPARSVYLRPFSVRPSANGRCPRTEGTQPRWRSDGKVSFFYLEGISPRNQLIRQYPFSWERDFGRRFPQAASSRFSEVRIFRRSMDFVYTVSLPRTAKDFSGERLLGFETSTDRRCVGQLSSASLSK